VKRPSTATPPLYARDGKGYDAVVYAHYFIGSSDWLVTEYDPAEDIAFGWACLAGDRQMAELGYVSLAELAEIEVRPRPRRLGWASAFAFRVEFDEDWQPCSLADAIVLLDHRKGI